MEKLKKYRQAKGVTQKALAKLLSVSQSKLSKFETGAMTPDVSEAFLIEKITGGAVPAKSWAEISEGVE